MTKYDVTIHLEDKDVTYVKIGLLRMLWEVYVGVTFPTKVSVEKVQ